LEWIAGPAAKLSENSLNLVLWEDNGHRSEEKAISKNEQKNLNH